ncbi:helix-turn-helix transcriptional regulator [Burkholderia pyrrocinia]|uniref:helix-turn-helix domain-containing protein n=1 Tax=Burkholderia pyrrocinia TaxID=60550 RepID=UPI00157704DA|nr:helix-turn-helix transcriptional regulator [Burkholderia pyrrocinia]NTX26783.1 helix-turn-helix transcriptional regulator [Burkholderia pyrrocinia]
MRSEAQIGTALQRLRELAQVTQEDFGVVSSRTYVSSVERGLKSPTLGKVEQLASVLGVHPLILLTVAYMDHLNPKEIERTTEALRSQLLNLLGKV